LDTQEGENFVLEQGLIGVGVMRAGVAVPNSRNYSPSPISPQLLHSEARSTKLAQCGVCNDSINVEPPAQINRMAGRPAGQEGRCHSRRLLLPAHAKA